MIKFESLNHFNHIALTSDTHYNHKNLCRGSSSWPDTSECRDFDSLEQMNDTIIAGINSVVTPDTLLIHNGDVSFGGKGKYGEFLARINTPHFIHIQGNHDHHHLDKPTMKFFQWKGFKFVCCHYPMLIWHQSHKEAALAFGHCMDLETEVLTDSGFKFRGELNQDDLIATLNKKSLNIEYNKINNFVDTIYTGELYQYNSTFMNCNFTEDHMIYYNTQNNSELISEPIKDINRRYFRIPVNGNNIKSDYSISNDLLRLYVQLVTDGSLETRTLCRFHLKKPRKIQRVKNLLEKLNISYSENLQKLGTTKINFTIPQQLLSYSIKPLDKFVRNLSKRQVDILLEEYCHTDGIRYSEKSCQLSTSKRVEADLLQEILVTSGYSCTLVTRKSDRRNPSYIMNVNTRNFSTQDTLNLTKKFVKNKPMWCLKVDNQTLVVRRNDKVHITGNCHDSNPGVGKSQDVGIDAVYNMFGQYRPLHLKEFIKIVSDKATYLESHHTSKTN